MSPAEIETRARDLVMYELSGQPGSHARYARHVLVPQTHAVDIEVHNRAAELYAELIAAAPEVWNATKEADRG